jgi:hypothetical protein
MSTEGTRRIRFHPIANRFPIVMGAAYESLREDIRTRGLLRPVAMLDGMVWDGRARMQACIEVAIPTKFRILRQSDDPLIYLLARHDRYGAPQSPERDASLKILRAIDSEEWKAFAARERAGWIDRARREFRSIVGRTQPCAVCGKHREFVHAHHSLPLNIQYNLGLERADHTHDWLCPVHHRHIHMLISVWMLGTREGWFLDDGVADDRQTEWWQVEDVYRRGDDLYRAYGGTHQNGRGQDPEHDV